VFDHVTIRASDRAASERFYALVLATLGIEASYSGDQVAGDPRERDEYHAGYYGAFVLDPDGNNVEAVNRNR
jgi:catechol 2,3-dioxygenase-like lactoylglutathione lyase family enzyme